MEWRCFHCGEVFKSEAMARSHFGVSEDVVPGCVLKVQHGTETSILELVRKLESENAELLRQMNEEDTQGARAMYKMQSRHVTQLRIAEEHGYGLGLLDGIDFGG